MDKMAAILPATYQNASYLNKMFIFWLKLNWKFPHGSTDYKSALVQVMIWGQIGDKRFPELMTIQLTDACMS